MTMGFCPKPRDLTHGSKQQVGGRTRQAAPLGRDSCGMATSRLSSTLRLVRLSLARSGPREARRNYAAVSRFPRVFFAQRTQRARKARRRRVQLTQSQKTRWILFSVPSALSASSARNRARWRNCSARLLSTAPRKRGIVYSSGYPSRRHRRTKWRR